MATETEFLRLPVVGMTCGHCVASVQKALESVPGVRSASVILDPRSADVEFEAGSAIDRERLSEAISSAGYSVSEPEIGATVRICRTNPFDWSRFLVVNPLDNKDLGNVNSPRICSRCDERSHFSTERSHFFGERSHLFAERSHFEATPGR